MSKSTAYRGKYDYGMNSSAGNRLIHNRIMTIKKRVNDTMVSKKSDALKKATALNLIKLGIDSYSSMHSKIHPEYHSETVIESFLFEMEQLVFEVTLCSDFQAFGIVSNMWLTDGKGFICH